MVNFEKEIEVINIEIDHLNVEKKAFIEFADRIEELGVENMPISKRNSYLINNERRTNISDKIRQIYSDTVLDMAHYDEIYDEPIEENMVHELGCEIYTVTEESCSLTSNLKNWLISAAVDAANRRKDFKQVIKKEKRYIKDFEQILEDICERSTRIRDAYSRAENFSQNIDIYNRFEELLGRCEELTINRQKQIQSRKAVPSGFYNGDFEEYLYSDLTNQYPILNLLSKFARILKKDIYKLATTRKSS